MKSNSNFIFNSNKNGKKNIITGKSPILKNIFNINSNGEMNSCDVDDLSANTLIKQHYESNHLLFTQNSKVKSINNFIEICDENLDKINKYLLENKVDQTFTKSILDESNVENFICNFLTTNNETKLVPSNSTFSIKDEENTTYYSVNNSGNVIDYSIEFKGVYFQLYKEETNYYLKFFVDNIFFKSNSNDINLTNISNLFNQFNNSTDKSFLVKRGTYINGSLNTNYIELKNKNNGIKFILALNTNDRLETIPCLCFVNDFNVLKCGSPFVYESLNLYFRYTSKEDSMSCIYIDQNGNTIPLTNDVVDYSDVFNYSDTYILVEIGDSSDYNKLILNSIEKDSFGTGNNLPNETLNQKEIDSYMVYEKGMIGVRSFVPVSTQYTYGLLKVQSGNGLVLSDDGVLSFDGEIGGGSSDTTNVGGILTSFVFCQTLADLSEFQPQGGSYENPYPDNQTIFQNDQQYTIRWTDGITTTGTGRVWMTKCTFYSNGQQSNWSSPMVLRDTQNMDIEYHIEDFDSYQDALNSLKDPSTGQFLYRDDSNYSSIVETQNGWTNTPDDEALWMAISIKENGVWKNWSVNKIKGERGLSGDTTIYSFTRTNTDISSYTCKGITNNNTPKYTYNNGEQVEINWGDSDNFDSQSDTLWCIKLTFNKDNVNIQEIEWEKPFIFQDTQFTEYQYTTNIFESDEKGLTILNKVFSICDKINTQGNPTSDSNTISINRNISYETYKDWYYYQCTFVGNLCKEGSWEKISSLLSHINTFDSNIDGDKKLFNAICHVNHWYDPTSIDEDVDNDDTTWGEDNNVGVMMKWTATQHKSSLDNWGSWNFMKVYGEDGINASNSFTYDLSNDMFSIGVGSDKILNNIENDIETHTTLYGWFGTKTAEISIIKTSIEDNDNNNDNNVKKIIVSNEENIINITIKPDTKFENNKQIIITFDLSYTENDKEHKLKNCSTTFTIIGVPSGKDGQIFELLPTSNVIKKDKENNYKPSILYCNTSISDTNYKVLYVLGNNTDIDISKEYNLSGGKLFYTGGSINDVNIYNTSGVNINNDDGITFYLFNTIYNKIVDIEYIPVIFDGTNGLNGSNGLTQITCFTRTNVDLSNCECEGFDKDNYIPLKTFNGTNEISISWEDSDLHNSNETLWCVKCYVDLNVDTTKEENENYYNDLEWDKPFIFIDTEEIERQYTCCKFEQMGDVMKPFYIYENENNNGEIIKKQKYTLNRDTKLESLEGLFYYQYTFDTNEVKSNEPYIVKGGSYKEISELVDTNTNESLFERICHSNKWYDPTTIDEHKTPLSNISESINENLPTTWTCEQYKSSSYDENGNVIWGKWNFEKVYAEDGSDGENGTSIKIKGTIETSNDLPFRKCTYTMGGTTYYWYQNNDTNTEYWTTNLNTGNFSGFDSWYTINLTSLDGKVVNFNNREYNLVSQNVNGTQVKLPYLEEGTTFTSKDNGHLYNWDGDSWNDLGQIKADNNYIHQLFTTSKTINDISVTNIYESSDDITNATYYCFVLDNYEINYWKNILQFDDTINKDLDITLEYGNDEKLTIVYNISSGDTKRTYKINETKQNEDNKTSLQTLIINSLKSKWLKVGGDGFGYDYWWSLSSEKICPNYNESVSWYVDDTKTTLKTTIDTSESGVGYPSNTIWYDDEPNTTLEKPYKWRMYRKISNVGTTQLNTPSVWYKPYLSEDYTQNKFPSENILRDTLFRLLKNKDNTYWQVDNNSNISIIPSSYLQTYGMKTLQNTTFTQYVSNLNSSSYVLSFYTKDLNNSISISIQESNSLSSEFSDIQINPLTIEILSDDWKRKSYNFNLSKQVCKITFTINSTTNEYISLPKLEQGVTPTDWTLNENDKVGQDGKSGSNGVNYELYLSNTQGVIKVKEYDTNNYQLIEPNSNIEQTTCVFRVNGVETTFDSCTIKLNNGKISQLVNNTHYTISNGIIKLNNNLSTKDLFGDEISSSIYTTNKQDSSIEFEVKKTINGELQTFSKTYLLVKSSGIKGNDGENVKQIQINNESKRINVNNSNIPYTQEYTFNFRFFDGNSNVTNTINSENINLSYSDSDIEIGTITKTPKDIDDNDIENDSNINYYLISFNINKLINDTNITISYGDYEKTISLSKVVNEVTYDFLSLTPDFINTQQGETTIKTSKTFNYIIQKENYDGVKTQITNINLENNLTIKVICDDQIITSGEYSINGNSIVVNKTEYSKLRFEIYYNNTYQDGEDIEINYTPKDGNGITQTYYSLITNTDNILISSDGKSITPNTFTCQIKKEVYINSVYDTTNSNIISYNNGWGDEKISVIFSNTSLFTKENYDGTITINDTTQTGSTTISLYYDGVLYDQQEIKVNNLIQGLNGPVVRLRSFFQLSDDNVTWTTNPFVDRTYCNGQNTSGKITYIDYVMLPKKKMSNSVDYTNFVFLQCILDHTIVKEGETIKIDNNNYNNTLFNFDGDDLTYNNSKVSELSKGDIISYNEQDYWQVCEAPTDTTITNTLIAQQINAKTINSNQITISDKDQNIQGGMVSVDSFTPKDETNTNGDTILWVGDKTPSTAPFQVDITGKLTFIKKQSESQNQEEYNELTIQDIQRLYNDTSDDFKEDSIWYTESNDSNINNIMNSLYIYIKDTNTYEQFNQDNYNWSENENSPTYNGTKVNEKNFNVYKENYLKLYQKNNIIEQEEYKLTINNGIMIFSKKISDDNWQDLYDLGPNGINFLRNGRTLFNYTDTDSDGLKKYTTSVLGILDDSVGVDLNNGLFYISKNGTTYNFYQDNSITDTYIPKDTDLFTGYIYVMNKTLNKSNVPQKFYEALQSSTDVTYTNYGITLYDTEFKRLNYKLNTNNEVLTKNDKIGEFVLQSNDIKPYFGLNNLNIYDESKSKQWTYYQIIQCIIHNEVKTTQELKQYIVYAPIQDQIDTIQEIFKKIKELEDKTNNQETTS